MKVYKFLTAMLLVTLFALLYVWQQTEVFRLAYVGQKQLNSFDELLDKNTCLRYNIEKNSSLTRVGSKVTQDADLQLPDTYRIVKVLYPRRLLVKASVQSSKKETLFSRLLGVGRQAEAQTINP